MMKSEFESLAGYEVSAEDYTNIIEPMYYASNLDKFEFVKTINKKRFALVPLKTLAGNMKKCAQALKETCTHFTDYATREKMENIIVEYIGRKYGTTAKYFISEKMEQSCFYPVSVEIYGAKDYQTIEKIFLIKN